MVEYLAFNHSHLCVCCNQLSGLHIVGGSQWQLVLDNFGGGGKPTPPLSRA